jgi:hypothetical protein
MSPFYLPFCRIYFLKHLFVSLPTNFLAAKPSAFENMLLA